MLELRRELAKEAADLAILANVAMTMLDLEPYKFALFTGNADLDIDPQRLFEGSDVRHTQLPNHVSYYGGRIATEHGGATSGQIQATIFEPISDGDRHQAGPMELPVPFIRRNLAVKNGQITVDTPVYEPTNQSGPVISETVGHNLRFRETTVYDTRSGIISIRTGDMITDGQKLIADRTLEIDGTNIPDEILLLRLAVVLRTVKAVSSIFAGIVWRDENFVRSSIIEKSRS